MSTNTELSSAGTGLTVNVPPVVKIDSFFQIGPHAVPATFDLSRLPAEHHELFLQLVQSRSITVPLLRTELKPAFPATVKAPRSLLSRILDWRLA